MFGNIDEMSGYRFKNVSYEDMQNYQRESFDNLFKIGKNQISEYTMEQIKAKSSIVGLNESLTAQALSMAKDADFTAKAATGKLTYKAALKDNAKDIDKISEALEKSNKLNDIQKKHLSGFEKNSKGYKDAVTAIINGNDSIGDSFIDLGGNIESSSGKLGNVFKGLAGSFKSFFTSVPGILTLVGAGITAAVKAFDYFYVSRDEAIEKAAKIM